MVEQEKALSNFKCTCCDYNTSRKYNLERHMVLKHQTEIATLQTEIATPASTLLTEKATPASTPSSLIQNDKQCNICTRIFTRRCNMLNHRESCTGINKLQCQYCDSMFAFSSGKAKHLRTCKVKLNMEKEEENAYLSSTINNIENQTNNNIQNQTNIETQNNNTSIETQNNTVNNNVIVLNLGHMDQLKTDHISQAVLRALCNTNDRQLLLSQYSKEIFKNPDNRCVRKTNMKKNTSLLHVGENKWDLALDKPVYSSLIGNIATSFGSQLNDYNIRLAIRSLEDFLESMTCEGEHGDSEDKEEVVRVKAAFRALVMEVKLLLFNYCKTDMTKTKIS
jgi:hypothetical protein